MGDPETGDLPPVFLLRITVHDFYRYASRELGRISETAPYVHNTALSYAVNRLSPIHRVATDLIPHYEDDFPQMRIYVTPAAMWGGARPAVGSSTVKFGWSPDRAALTQNAVNTATQVTEVESRVFPALITYMSYQPLTTFRAYSIGGAPPPVVRIGKKEPPARVISEGLSDVKLRRGVFRPDHPVNPTDLPRETRVIRAELYDLRPCPLLLDAELDGPHLVGRDGSGGRHRIALPDPARYRGVPGLGSLGDL